jgi:hypothetical protein
MFGVGVDLTGQNAFSVKQSGTFTVPRTLSVVSPTTQYLSKSLDTVRDVVGGQIMVGLTDAASGEPGGAVFIGIELKPGDVILLSAVASNVVTVSVNGTVVYRLTGVTAVAAIFGFYN